MKRIIMLVDMDYFFAACEELRRPEIKGKPVIVGADPKGGKGRGVVSTCNYEARKYGIHSGMPISIAYKIKSDAIFLPVDEKYYYDISAKIMNILKSFASKFEQISVDEAFLDVTDKVEGYESALSYAAKIKEKIWSETKLPCSVGIGENKLLAKTACEAAKPNGIKLIKESEAKEFLAKLPIGKLYGIGKKTEEKLVSLGYKTVGDLQKADINKLIGLFGAFGGELYRHANGIDYDEVNESYEVKSIGREHTFEMDTTNKEEIIEALKKCATEVVEDLRKQNLSFKTVTIKIRYSDFTEHIKSKSLKHYSNALEDIENNAIELFEDYALEGEEIRKVGVRVSGLLQYRGQKRLTEYFYA